MQIYLQDNIDSYRTFLRIKGLPRYEIHGRMAYVPDEYASTLGLSLQAETPAEYVPRPGLFDYQEAIVRLAMANRAGAARPGRRGRRTTDGERTTGDGLEGEVMDCLAFDHEIAVAVAVIRERKIRRMRANYFPQRKKRKPRFCVTTTVQLCPRQRAKKYRTS